MRIFKEEQRFTQQWLVILLIISTIVPIILVTNKFIKNNMDLGKYVMSLSIVLLASGLIFIFKLKTRIDKTGIHYQFFPLHFKMKTILWQDIKYAETRTYDAILEYGGWGIKGGYFWNKKKGIAYNVKGDIGIQLTLKTGKKILIGTQKRTGANSIIAKYLEQKTNG